MESTEQTLTEESAAVRVLLSVTHPDITSGVVSRDWNKYLDFCVTETEDERDAFVATELFDDVPGNKHPRVGINGPSTESKRMFDKWGNVRGHLPAPKTKRVRGGVPCRVVVAFGCVSADGASGDGMVSFDNGGHSKQVAGVDVGVGNATG